MNQNPVTAFREGIGLSRLQIAIRLGINYLTFYEVEAGYRVSISPRIAKGLVKLGAPQDIAEQYRQWRSQQAG